MTELSGLHFSKIKRIWFSNAYLEYYAYSCQVQVFYTFIDGVKNRYFKAKGDPLLCSINQHTMNSVALKMNPNGQKDSEFDEAGKNTSS